MNYIYLSLEQRTHSDEGESKRSQSTPISAAFEKIVKHRKYHLKIVSTPGGIGYEVSGQIFRSPSTAAKSITNTGC
jgi:hypothetical protein